MFAGNIIDFSFYGTIMDSISLLHGKLFLSFSSTKIVSKTAFSQFMLRWEIFEKSLLVCKIGVGVGRKDLDKLARSWPWNRKVEWSSFASWVLSKHWKPKSQANVTEKVTFNCQGFFKKQVRGKKLFFDNAIEHFYD